MIGGVSQVEHVAISRDPRAQFWQKVARVMARPGDWGRLTSRAKNTVEVARLPSRLNASGIANADRARVHFVEHHRAHLASAFFASPFDEAAVVSIDGFGDYRSVMWGVGRGTHIDVRGRVQFPHSLGQFYTAFTQLLGFLQYGDEYKMVDLSAYGKPRLAASVQLVLEECYFALLNEVQKRTGMKRVCLAGGVALNCVANGKIFDKTPFEELYVQPAAHDAGTSIGAALHVHHEVLNQPRGFVMRHVLYGPRYSDAEIQRVLNIG